jgi:hypothetical protein
LHAWWRWPIKDSNSWRWQVRLLDQDWRSDKERLNFSAGNLAFDFQTPVNRYNVNNDYNYRLELVDIIFLNRMVVFQSP